MVPNPFAQTDGMLVQDSTPKMIFLLAVPMVLGLAWGAWLVFARVNVYATTDEARVEVAQAVYRVQSPVSGRVVESYLELGKNVTPGAVLVELETNPQKFRLQEEETQQAALKDQIENLRRERDEQLRALNAARAAGRLAISQEQTSVAEAEEASQLAEEEYEKEKALKDAGLASTIELRRKESEFKEKSLQLKSLRDAVRRGHNEQAQGEGERKARIQEIDAEIGRISGELSVSDTTTQGLLEDLGSRRIVAMAGGRLDQTANLKPGSYVSQGDQLATIVPEGALRIVAYFDPRGVIGRVKVGQTGRLRLAGFPSAQYGSVMGSVTSVGSEIHDGRVRVELSGQSHAQLPLQHGMVGSLEIQIDRVSPAFFLLRTAGLYFSPPQAGAAKSP